MSLYLRSANARGHANHGWLDSFHSFSFANYYDPNFMGFGPLRVINEDRVEAGMGFGTHGHRDMEIISYVVSGELEHKDSLGSGSVIRPGDVQVMSAGAGIRHSEFNPSAVAPVHFLQIWIMPERNGVTPRYDQKTFAAEEKSNRLRLVASRDGRDGSLKIHQDADVYASVIDAERSVDIALRPGRKAWIQVVRGALDVNGVAMRAGDGLAAADETTLAIAAREKAEIILFDLP